MSDQQPQQPSAVVLAYPSIARWAEVYGWIEIGYCPPLRSFIRALDEGGMIWEGAPTYPTLDNALRALEAALTDWLHEQGLD